MKLKQKLGILLAVATVAVVVVGVLSAGAFTARSRDSVWSDPNAPKDTFVHDIGNFGNQISNELCVGSQPRDETFPPSGEWPLGSGMDYLYMGGFWFGNESALISIDFFNKYWYPLSPIYNTRPGATNPLPGSFGVQEGVNFAWMADYWREDRPTRVADQDAHFYADDTGHPNPLGFEVVIHSMAWSAPGHDEWLTMNYWLRYTGEAPLDPLTFAAFWYDIDVGTDHLDDVVGYDGIDPTIDNYCNITWTPGADGIPDQYDTVNYPMELDNPNYQPYHDILTMEHSPRHLSYMYNVEELPGEPGYCGVRVMRAVINPGHGDGPHGEREYIVTSSHSWDWNNDPATEEHKFAYMVDVGTYEVIDTPFDWRILPSVGPLRTVEGEGMRTGDVLELRKLWVIGDGLNGMRANADQALTDALGFNGKFDDPYAGEDVTDYIVLAPPTNPLLSAVVGDASVTLRWDPNITGEINIETQMDITTGNQVDFEGYRIYRATTLDRLGSGTDLRPWFASEANIPWDVMPEHQPYDVGGDTPVYARDTLAQWDKDINHTPWEEQWPPDPNNPDNPDYPREDDDPYYIGPASMRAPGYALNDNSQWKEFNPLNNWAQIFADPYDGEGFAAGSTTIYEYTDDGTNYHNWDKWPYDDYDVPKPTPPRNHFTYYYAVVPYDYGASPIYNANIGDDPLPSLEAGVRANFVKVTLGSGVTTNLDDVLVVPNPYVGGVDWQGRSVTGVVERKLAFTNLPPRCTIRIYTISGDLVAIVEHNDATTGTAWWDLQSRNRMEVASGVYVYHIDAPGIGTKIGKFAVLMGERI